MKQRNGIFRNKNSRTIDIILDKNFIFHRVSKITIQIPKISKKTPSKWSKQKKKKKRTWNEYVEHPELTTLLPLQCFLAHRCFFTPPCRAFPIVIRHLENVLTLHLFLSLSLFLSNSWWKKEKKEKRVGNEAKGLHSYRIDRKNFVVVFFLFSFGARETFGQ